MSKILGLSSLLLALIIWSSKGTFSGSPIDMAIGSVVGVVLGFIFIPSFRQAIMGGQDND